MRYFLIALTLAACGGELLGVTADGDAAYDAPLQHDATPSNEDASTCRSSALGYWACYCGEEFNHFMPLCVPSVHAAEARLLAHQRSTGEACLCWKLDHDDRCAPRECL